MEAKTDAKTDRALNGMKWKVEAIRSAEGIGLKVNARGKTPHYKR